MSEDTRPPLDEIDYPDYGEEPSPDWIAGYQAGVAAERERLRVAVEGLRTLGEVPVKYGSFTRGEPRGASTVYVQTIERDAVLRLLSDDHAEPEPQEGSGK